MTARTLDEWPRRKTSVKVIPFGGKDDDGRCSFELLWWDGDRRRAQCFFAEPGETARRLRATIRERRQA